MSNSYTTAAAIERLRYSNRVFGYILIVVLVALCLPLFMQPKANAQDARVVTIYADGTEQTFATDAKTVGQALERANIELSAHDLVEPGEPTSITTDSFKINVYRARPILVIDGDQRISVLTPYQSPRLIAEDAGLTVYPEDEYELSRVNDIVALSTLGLKLEIDRATPIRLNMYGTVETVRTQAETVGDFVAGLKLQNSEKEVVVRPKNEVLIEEGMMVYVVTISDDTVAVEEKIPYPSREIRDTSRPLGYQEVRTPGRDGSKLVTYRVTLENGKEISRKVINSVVVTQPVEAVVVVGAKYDMSDAFARLRQCESGGNYANKNNPLYRGAYQFLPQTWNTVAPAEYVGVDPADAPPWAQDLAALTLQQRSGWGQWPACASSLGLL